MFRRIKFALFGLAFLLLLPTSVAPAMAAGPSNPPPPPMTQITPAQMQTMIANLPAPTAQQIADAKAILTEHPLQGTVSIQYAPPSGGKLSPYLSVGHTWYGWYMHFTPNDVHVIWLAVWAGGIGGAATALCAPGLVLAIVCGAGGAVLAVIVAELIWNVIGYYVPSCGVHIGYTFWGTFTAGWC
jgi:hypothetical protein